MSVKIITDSTSDISKELAKEWGVEIIPLTVHFDGEEYLDGVTLTPSEFYKKLESSPNLPTTSQVTVDTFIKAFEAATADGSEVVCITLSSELSGTYQSAAIAKSTLNNDKIHLVDSRNVTLGLALLVHCGVELRDKDMSGKLIAETLTLLSKKLRLYAMIDTLKYLKKGGRLSAVSTVVGTMLGIKPIITIESGRVEVCHKTRGMKSALEWIISEAGKANPDRELGFSFGHTDSPQQMELLVSLADKWKNDSKVTCCIGCVVGTHAGPGCIGMAFFEQ